MWGSTEYQIYNEASRLLKFTVDRGRDEVFGSGFNSYDIGKLIMELDNHDGRYDPWNTSGPLYGDIKPGVKMRFRANYDGTLYTFFTGQLEDMKVNGYNNTVTLTCEDGWRYLRDNEFSLSITSSTDYATVFEPVIASTGGNYPWGNDITTTTDGIPTFYWYDGDTYKGFVEDVTFGSLGRAAIRSNGDLYYRNLMDSTDAAAITILESEALRDIYLPLPWDNYRSKINLDGNKTIPSTGSTDTVVAQWVGNEKIYGGSSYTSYMTIESGYYVDYPTTDDITIEGWRSGVPETPLTSTSYDLSLGEMTVSRIYYTIDCTLSGDSHIRVESVTYYGLSDTRNEFSFEYETTDSSVRDSEFTVDSDWLTLAPSTASTYDYDKGIIDDVGNTLVNYLSMIRPFPVIKLQGRYADQFGVDLEDKVTLTYSTLNISGDYRVSKISHETLSSPQDVITTLWLYPVMEKST
jgi:hypothetical protein